MNRAKKIAISGIVLLSGLTLVACTKSASSDSNGKIIAVGSENEYANVISQIGGRYVSVTAIMSNPATDPHSYEANTKDASTISKATLVVQNGLGYDNFMNKIESGSKNSKRNVIDVSKALNYPSDTKNPHLWYKTYTMVKLSALVAENLKKQLPEKKQYFEDNLTKFNNSINEVNSGINKLKDEFAGTGVAVTEPVSDYLIESAGLKNMTPWNYQAAVMNGTDPSPQDVRTQENLFKDKKVNVFLYNQQAVDSSTKELLSLAKQNNIPVVGVYETMPTGYSYQKWISAETDAISKAIKDGVSTNTLS
ncbi:metal ABC transporter solute-binding protein, Zn/Mn family [Lactovum miscens]|uniref:Zinc/manganese transport system substrate-binding protein n=1 Tax=Lactovum miscens TaxID=190387 RepID=A0A841C2Z9_9LACT|nr:zinc ABC transporter substrate-binding protein [Lactovum miscens]MBB5888336.1 zinc/manganese transport system substrate-binding protein [Lactovum miscens]